MLREENQPSEKVFESAWKESVHIICTYMYECMIYPHQQLRQVDWGKSAFLYVTLYSLHTNMCIFWLYFHLHSRMRQRVRKMRNRWKNWMKTKLKRSPLEYTFESIFVAEESQRLLVNTNAYSCSYLVRWSGSYHVKYHSPNPGH